MGENALAAGKRFITWHTKVILTKVRCPAILEVSMETKQGLPSASTGAVATPMEKRHEKRLHLAVPVKVFPDITSLESQNCCTYEISTNGARLVAPPGIKTVGQTIWLQRQNRRARYKVLWIGEAGSSLAGQVGVETLEPSNVIWEPEIKARIMRS
jgi:hypothetical protein